MRCVRRFVLVATIAAAVPSAAAAQADTVYVGTKSRLAAGILEYFVPTVGFAYAGDWTRGLAPNAVRLGGLILFANSEAFELNNPTDECGADCSSGAVLFLAGTIWAIVDATKTARDHNVRVTSGGSASGLRVGPGVDGSVEVGWTLPLGN